MAALRLSEICKYVRDSLGGEGIVVKGGLVQRAANTVNYHVILFKDIAKEDRKRLKLQVAIRYHLKNEHVPKHKQIAMKTLYRKYIISREEFMEGLHVVD